MGGTVHSGEECIYIGEGMAMERRDWLRAMRLIQKVNIVRPMGAWFLIVKEGKLYTYGKREN